MRILRIRVEGLPLYRAPFDVSFYAVQRVQSSHLQMVHKLSGNIFLNTAEAFIGINASGKTTALKVISFASMLLNAAPLNAEYIPQILGENKVLFTIDFYDNQTIYRLTSEVQRKKNKDAGPGIHILSEHLWAKPLTSKTNKTNLLCFDGQQPIRVRDSADEYLPDDVSIMIALIKKMQTRGFFIDLADFTNFNLFLPNDEIVPEEIISLLDPTISYIRIEKINNKHIARLKFHGQDELVLYNLADLNIFLSSGTVKGVRVFMEAARVLKNGGYLLVDEIENHFNQELVASLLRLFMNQKTNPKGAVLIFSTHYPELLDELERNDSVFITRNDHGLTVDNLNSLLKRNDLRKSDIYQSNFLGGTAPKYTALLALQKSIIRSLEE